MAEILVDTKQGVFKGRSSKDANGSDFYSFQGIPYAKPPLGKLRFRAPQPAEPHEGIWDATVERDECYAAHMILNDKLVGSEDCLYLNVYTPSISKGDKDELKAVMVWIHGGGFVTGSSKTDLYGPEYLVANDVVLVTFNYRLGALGFLNLEGRKLGVPGNAGMKDQVLALKWIQENISSFGGDPSNVTIFGESAGAASVHYMMLSPMGKGLFHRAIAQSGSALNFWARGNKNGKELARNLGFASEHDEDILNFLEKVPVDKLYEAQEKLKEPFPTNLLRPFGPIIEKPSSEPAFLLEEPIDTIRSGNYNHVPLLIGYNDRESILTEIMYRGRGEELLPNIDNIIPYILNVERGTPEWQGLVQKFKDFYFGDEEPSAGNWEKYIVMDSDSTFIRKVYSTAKNHVATSKCPVFFYIFSFDGKINLYKKYYNITTSGACHADDLAYLFKNHYMPEIVPGSPEDKTLKRMTKFWTNFAKYGDPNPKESDPLIDVEWKPVLSENEITYLEIGEELSVGVNPEPERNAFWDKIFQSNPATMYF